MLQNSEKRLIDRVVNSLRAIWPEWIRRLGHEEVLADAERVYWEVKGRSPDHVNAYFYLTYRRRVKDGAVELPLLLTDVQRGFSLSGPDPGLGAVELRDFFQTLRKRLPIRSEICLILQRMGYKHREIANFAGVGRFGVCRALQHAEQIARTIDV